MPPKQRAFTIATGLPVLLLLAASFWGGVWIWLALAYLTVFTGLLDVVIAKATDQNAADQEFPAANLLSAALAVAHFILLCTVIYSLSGAVAHSLASGLALFFSHVLFFGQVSNANAHELIHRNNKLLFLLGKWVYISLLFGHHTSAHRLVHHRWVGCKSDPNTPRLGENFYHFAKRAWLGSFRKGLKQENTLRARALKAPPLYSHPYGHYILGGVGFCLMAVVIGGITGLLIYLPLALLSQMQLLQSDYVQHYGLRRQMGTNGKPEPVDPSHSWNSPHWYSGVLMLHAPRHSDHHAHPATPYPNLRLSDDLPMLPYSLPVMAALALFPRRYRRLMDQRASVWHKEMTHDT